MGKPSVASVAPIRTAPFAGFNAFPALKIDLVHDPRNPLTRCGSIPNVTTWAAWREDANRCGLMR